MNAFNKGILAALATVALAGCGDPFNAEPGGTPKVISAVATVDGTPYDGVASGGGFTISGIPGACSGGTATVTAPVFFVKMNKLLNGFSVQKNAADCTPANNWLTVTPAAPVGETWYACYNPSSPSPDEGGSVVIFRAPTAPAASGWLSAGDIEASGTGVTSYHATGTVSDKDGTGVAIDLTVNVDPDPGTPVLGTYTAIATTSLTVNWSAVCVASTYTVERAPDVAGVPGTYAVVSAAQAGLSFGDTGLTAATKYWYRVTADGPATTSTATSVTTLP